MELKMLEMTKIVANSLQPRQVFDGEKLQELANSIRESELLQPIIVRKNNGSNFEIVAGERRFKAFQILKEPRIPAIILNIKDDIDALLKSLIENLQRDDLTSVERENAVSQLWESKRYKSQSELARKLGMQSSPLSAIIRAKEDRKNLDAASTVSTRVIHDTEGLDDSSRKKIIKLHENGKIEHTNVRDVVRKVKEFPEPEQQLEILEDFENAEKQTREVFADIIRKKKEIAEGKREPEHTVKIESDADKRMLNDYKDIKARIFYIYSGHIKHFDRKESKDEAIRIIQDIIVYLNKQLVSLDVIKEVDL